MRMAGCVVLIYLAAVIRMMGGEGMGVVDLSAVAVVVAARWCSPGRAAMLAFLTGLIADGLGAGPLGTNAAAAVSVAALLSRFGFAAENWPASRWICAILLSVSVNAAAAATLQLVRQGCGEDLLRRLGSQSMTAVATALVIGVIVWGWRFLSGAPCATR